MFDPDKPNDGGPAFPNPHNPVAIGMSLRDWFAGMALTTMIDIAIKLGPEYDHNVAKQSSRWAYEIADAMLKERTGLP